jgi:hypothetical protein
MIQSVCQIEANPHQFLARRSGIGAVGAPSQTFQKFVLRGKAQLVYNSKTQTIEKFRAFKVEKFYIKQYERGGLSHKLTN